MATPVIQTGFASGELAPAIYGKVDIDAYHQGAATMRNLFVDYRSGATSRAGFAFVGPGMNAYPDPPRLIPFRYSSAEAYVIVLGEQFARFIYNGAYVVETAQAITAATLADPCVLTVEAHGYATNDLIFVSGASGCLWPSNENSALNARFFLVNVIDANTFSLYDWITLLPINSTSWTAYVGAGTCARVYTLATPYASADLRAIVYAQSGDVLTLTHPSYPPADVVRVSSTEWTYTVDTFGSSLTPPTGLGFVANGLSGEGQLYSYKYVITAYNDNTKEESNASAVIPVGNLLLETGKTIPYNTLTWDAVAGATRYNVYSTYSVPAIGTAYNTITNIWGYIGQSETTLFNDTNIAPDYSESPPIHFDPFSGSGVSGVTITSPAVADPPTLLGILQPVVTYSGTASVAPAFAVKLSSDGWGNLVGGGAAISVTQPGDGLSSSGGSIVITDAAPGPGAGMVCQFALTFAEDPLLSLYNISNTCIAAAFVDGSAYHPLLNDQICPGDSALAFAGAPAVAAGTYNATTKLGTGYLMGGAATVRWTAGSVTGHAQGNIQLINGQATGMAVSATSAAVSGAAPTTYTWSIMYDDMAGNIVTVSGSVTAGVQGATTQSQVAYGSYTAPGDGFGPVPYVVGGTTYPFATTNFSAPPVGEGTYSVSGMANYPAVVCYFQGRKVFMASTAEPQTVWMTKPNLFSNMDYSNPSEATDGIDITINAQDLSTIVSATPVSIGLLLLTADGAWMVTGGGLYEPVTPSTINAQPQSFSGAAPLQPIRIGNEVLYLQARGYSIKKLTYSIYVSAYVPADISVLSSHLFDGRSIVEWTYAEQPYYLTWALRDDGVMLSLTYLQEQQITGWARHDTQGYFRSVTSIPQVPEGAS